MAKTSGVPFTGTEEQEKQLRAKLAELKNVKGGLMPALQEAQGIYGYLPKEVQIIVAEELGVSLSEVYGVVSFYSQFTIVPKGKYKVAVCLGTACYVKGSGDVLAEIEKVLGIKAGEITPDAKYSIDATRCIGCCGLAPVMTVNDDVYGRITPKEVKGILAKYE
ncbi:MAG: NAD(P)H-dependent oxidoreductase subunit E [Clostridia bacterium]|nr:NAD(P)H-dependent oxidoreductase subunit E [Clostridia bacterium]MBP5593203.1 NAD(P)H-dependent oxidoreductase subunit E [Clostridia bacterium]MBP5649042.1 NAD(P)H-dependent oxidoreductase subunit E [Clostridia bacterium]